MTLNIFVAVAATSRQVYVIVVIERGNHRLACVEITAYPSEARISQRYLIRR